VASEGGLRRRQRGGGVLDDGEGVVVDGQGLVLRRVPWYCTGEGPSTQDLPRGFTLVKVRPGHGDIDTHIVIHVWI
jgi:hypothetical protein